MCPEGQGEHGVDGRLVTLAVGQAGSCVWLGPMWAVLCGAVASGGLSLHWRTPVVLLLGVLLADSLLGSVWGLAGLEGRAPRRKRRGSSGGQSGGVEAPGPFPGLAALRVLDSSKARVGRWASRTWPRAGGSLLGWWFLPLWAVVIAGALGSVPLGLTVLALGLAAWRLAMPPSEGVLSSVMASCCLAGLPWLIGWAALGDIQFDVNELRPLSQALLWAAAYATTYHAYGLLGGQRLAGGSHLLAAAHLLAIVVLVAFRQPVLAAGVALLLLPQLMLQPALLSVGEGVWYLRRVQVFTMLATMVTAMAMAA